MLPVCQKKQVQLSRQFQQNSLAHAVIIQGIAGTGKEALACWLVDLLICQTPVQLNNSAEGNVIYQACGHCKTCLLRKSGTYPDHITFADNNKTLGVDDIRQGNTFLETKPHIGRVKTMCIPNAQNMTIASANALLKTLEEPNENTFIVLITDDLDSLLPTIVSRCAVYSIRPIVGDALLAELSCANSDSSHLSLSSQHAAENAFINLSQLPELTDENIRKDFEAFKLCLLAYLYEGQNEEMLLNLLVNNAHSLRWLEKVTSNLIRQYYLADTKGSSIMTAEQEIPIQTLNKIYQTIINSNKLIKSYAQTNQQFVAEQLVMTINEIVRPTK